MEFFLELEVLSPNLGNAYLVFSDPSKANTHAGVHSLSPTLCDPLDCSMPGFPVLHYLPDFAQNSCPLSW